MDDQRWIDLEPYWTWLKKVAAERERQKRRYRSTQNWARSSTHFLGVCGEMCVSVLLGIPFDDVLRKHGDNGADFRINDVRYDVKTSTFLASPDLKEFPKTLLLADCYILVAVDEPGKRARVVGWASQPQVYDAEIRNYGRGLMRSITHHEMGRLGQLGLPPRLRAMAEENWKGVELDPGWAAGIQKRLEAQS